MTKTTRRGGSDPVIASLWQADCTASLGMRVAGPRGVRTTFAESRGEPEVDDGTLAAALLQLEAARRVEDPVARRVLLAMINSRQCRRVATIRDVAAEVGIPVTTAHRKLRQAVAAVSYEWGQREAA